MGTCPIPVRTSALHCLQRNHWKLIDGPKKSTPSNGFQSCGLIGANRTLELTAGVEPAASALPKRCTTTVLRQRIVEMEGVEPSSLACKARALPLSYIPVSVNYVMDDPTAKDFIEAMNVLKQYTLDSQISLEGECLVACVMNGMEVVDDDRDFLRQLGWELTSRDGVHSHFSRPFADH